MSTLAPPARSKASSKRSGAAPRRSAGQMVLEALRAQVAELRAQEPGTRAAAPNAVARMRVATRQLRNTLDGFSRLLDKPAARAVSQEFKWPRASQGSKADEDRITATRRRGAALASGPEQSGGHRCRPRPRCVDPLRRSDPAGRRRAPASMGRAGCRSGRPSTSSLDFARWPWRSRARQTGAQPVTYPGATYGECADVDAMGNLSGST
jgi:inorganic triphosphatase YgiF